MCVINSTNIYLEMDDYEGIHIKFFSVVVSILMTFSDVPEQMIRDITTRK